MIKLIACDVDGTLLHGSETTLSPTLVSAISRLIDKGYHFAAASGRQYASLLKLFAPLRDRMYFSCENGAVLFGPGAPDAPINKAVMDRDVCMELCREVLAHKGYELLISGCDACYLPTGDQAYIRLIREFLGNKTAVIDAPEDTPEDIIKLAMYCPDPAATLREMAPRWADTFRIAVAGAHWVDFNITDKGTGIRALCEHLNIRLDEVMAIGDNFNDLAMLRLVGHPYIMENAAPELLAEFPNHCRDVKELFATLI